MESLMPIYEYRCSDCRRRSSVFVRSMSATVEPACEHCGSRAMERLISRVVLPKGARARLEAEIPQNPNDFYEFDNTDNASIASWARRVGHDIRSRGETLQPGFEQMVNDLEEGRMPERWVENGEFAAGKAAKEMFDTLDDPYGGGGEED
jgi:putative FmdB family regulatory protein